MNIYDGIDFGRIAEEFGTPLYIYNAETIRKQYREFSAAFSTLPVQIKYACKALTNPHILKEIETLGGGVDAVSINEAKIALAAGFVDQKIMFTPNCVDFEEIVEGVELGVQINIDNLVMLERFGQKYGDSIPVCVRLNPHIMAGGNPKISTGHIDSKFGISLYQIEEIDEVVKRYKIRVNGLHVHTGSDITNPEVFQKGAEILFHTAESHFPGLEFIDFGSGFKVPYKADDLETDLSIVAEKLSEAYSEFCDRYGSKPELWFEPGKYLVSESGYFLVKVTVVKETPVSTFIGVNSGLNHLIRPMMYDAYHEIINISNPNGRSKAYNVVGYICETDTFGYDRPLAEVREGDLLLIKNAGAYGFSMSSQFNSRPRTAEVLVDGDKTKLIRRRESLDDLMATVVDY